MTWAALLSLPLALATTPALTPGLLLAGAVLALLSSVIPYSLGFGVLRRIPARTFGILMSLERAIVTLLGYLLLSQHLAGPGDTRASRRPHRHPACNPGPTDL